MNKVSLVKFCRWGEKEKEPKKVRLNRPPQSPLALMSSRASSSVVVVLL